MNKEPQFWIKVISTYSLVRAGLLAAVEVFIFGLNFLTSFCQHKWPEFPADFLLGHLETIIIIVGQLLGAIALLKLRKYALYIFVGTLLLNILERQLAGDEHPYLARGVDPYLVLEFVKCIYIWSLIRKGVLR
jgi:hypothetical protein